MEQKNSSNNNNNNQQPPMMPKFSSYWIYGAIALILLIINFYSVSESSNEQISFNRLDKMIADRAVEKIVVSENKIGQIYLTKESLDKPEYDDAAKSKIGGPRPHYWIEIGDKKTFDDFLIGVQDAEEIPREERIYPTYKSQPGWISTLLSWVIPIGLFIIIWLFIIRRVGGAGGGAGAQIFNIGKSKAKLFDQNTKVSITFQDVAGLEEAKEEVMEVVDFLKNPKKYTALGGKIPKGVLLVGPPGTGKTLLAKAVAGEADVPFFSISGSDFVEMFVGVGASRVRDLFKQAREKAPCIVFIDEIDAIGRARGRGNFQGGNDERENTLNQLLVEMDGFATDKGVILMAATNRPDVLDSALMRPGRFDRQIGLERPDLKERAAIFKVHLKNIRKSEEIDPAVLAEMTPGFAGAEIANVCNEAALIAARRNKKSVEMEDFNYALDKVIGGLERKSKLISPREKKIIAYHEAGHAICGWFLEHASPLVKVTIVPRGIGTLGYAQYLPKDEYITRTDQLLDRMCMTFGGRAAEEIVFNEISTGAQNDLDRITNMAYGMITVYGMNDKVGQVSFYGMQRDQFSKPYSDETGTLIDEEVRKMVEAQYQRAKDLLTKHRDELEILAQTLLEKEVLLKSDLIKLIGERPFPDDEPIPEVENEPAASTDSEEPVKEEDSEAKIED